MLYNAPMTAYYEVFTHIDNGSARDGTPGDGKIRHFDVTSMWTAFLKDMSIAQSFKLSIDQYMYDVIFGRHGIEEKKVESLPLSFDVLPIFVCHMPSDTHLIIDGNHRIIKFYRLGFRELPGAMFEQNIWEKFLIDLPEEQSKQIAEEVEKCQPKELNKVR
jgi:hypothetical protein